PGEEDDRGEETLLSWWWDNAKLLHEAHSVHQYPAFFALASRTVIKPHASHRHPLPSRRNTEKLSLVGTAPDEGDCYPVPLCDHIFDGPFQVGEGRAHPGDGGYQGLSPWLVPRRGIKRDMVFRHQFCGHGRVALVDE